MASTTASKPASIASSGSAADTNSNTLNNNDVVKNGGGGGDAGGENAPSPAADAGGGRLDTARSSPQKHLNQKSFSQNNHASVMSLQQNHPLPHSTRLSAPGSSATSAVSSRETSPIRRPQLQSRNSTSNSRAPSRSRKSSQELSPSRRSSSSGPNYTAIPTPAAVQNALKNKPNLHPSATPAADPPVDASKPDKPDMFRRGDTSPISPRLKSPPPPLVSRNSYLPTITSPQRAEQEPSTRSNISTKRSNGPPADSPRHSPNYDVEDGPSTPGMRTPIRGASNGVSTLETVQEGSSPSTPATEKSTKTVTNLEEARLEKVDEDEPAPSIKSITESGSDSGGNKSALKAEEKANKKIKPGDIISKQSYTSLNTGRGKPGDASVRSMIVESETVSSVPQVSLGGTNERGGAGRADTGGSVRMKTSNETIRPKKEKKKSTRKPANLGTGTVSSKADIFEAKVASAVDEANSSDSDETFVYESNPTDPHPPSRPHRYHSRTPSATSMVSQMDQFAGGRSRNMGHNLGGKRSMRLSSHYYTNGYEGDGGDQGSGRGSRTNVNRTSSRHNLGRYTRDSDFPNNFDDSLHMSKSPRHVIGNGNRHSRSGSPRNPTNYRTLSSPKKNGDAYGFDYDAEGADDERTPLVGSVRINRSRNGRRHNNPSLRQMEFIEERKRWRLPRYANCILMIFLLTVVVGGVTSFIIALTKPLMGVHIDEIQNVLASEQEIMLDLDVRATNPNLFALTVGDMDVNIFAKSRYVGSEQFWRDGPHPEAFPRAGRAKRWASIGERHEQKHSEDAASSSSNEPIQPKDGVDRGTDPIPEDPSGDPQTMLLGRIFEFDSPLTFDPSPWTSEEKSSVGQVRLSKPGNKTEEGGTERWERVLQHPFDLIVRGVVKYQLPLSSKFRSASISSRVRVIPDDDDDDAGTGDGDGDDGDDEDEDSGRNDTIRIKPIRTRSFNRKFKLLPISTDSQSPPTPPSPSPTRAFVA